METTYVDIVTGEPFPVDDSVNEVFDWIIAQEAWLNAVHEVPPDLRVPLLLAAPVGLELINELRAIDPQTLDDEDRLLLAHLWERCVGWVTDQAAQASAVFIDAVMDPPEARVYVRSGHEVAAGVSLREVGVATGLSDNKAAMRILCGQALAPDGVLALTGNALRAGRISWEVAQAFVDATLSLTDEHRKAVQARVLPRAVAPMDPESGAGCWRSRSWAIAALRRAILAVDPGSTARKRERAQARRGVWLSFEHDTGMAYLTAYLPADQAMEAHDALNALAAAHRHEDQISRSDKRPRGWESARADALITSIRAALKSLEDHGSLPTVHGKTRVEVGVIIDLPTLLQMADHPGEILGYGPIDPHYARLLAAQAKTWRRWVLEPVTGHLLDLGRTRYRPTQELRDYILAAYPQCTRPECDRHYARTDIDHAVEWHDTGPTSAANLHSLCRQDHIDKTNGWTSANINPDGTITHTTSHGLQRTHEPHWKPLADNLTTGQTCGDQPSDEDIPPF